LLGQSRLHTGDIVRSVNGITIKTRNDFRQAIRGTAVGDTIAMEMQRSSGIEKINVVISSYQQPDVHIQHLSNATQKQEKIFTRWNNGTPLKN